MMQLRWLEEAHADVLNAAEYIAKFDVSAAIDLVDEVHRQAERLTLYPSVGRMGRVVGTRELPVLRTSYVLIYRVSAEDVTVLRVLHGAQRWPIPTKS